EVIARANDTEYGLVAYVVTENGARQMRLARALEYGMVAVNRVKITGGPIPFGGWKQSGLGREGSRHGMEAFTELKYLCIDTSVCKERPWSTDATNSPPGTATTSSIPPPIWACMSAARRRRASSAAANASTSPPLAA